MSVSLDKRRNRKKMTWTSLITLVLMVPSVFIYPNDFGDNQTQVLIAIIYVLGALVLTYNGVTAFERWTDNKHSKKEN
jgi:threonine/homoserine/homoserine lactone efflux protein